jgi:DNA (cytosine-5)-methyltransferase 1
MQQILWYVKSRRAQSDQDYETWIGGGLVPTLNAFENANDTRATVIIFYGNRVDDIRIQDEKINTLQARMGTGGGNMPLMNEGAVVRRLTPVECERLQGFPDNWTEGQADTHRYKQMGNAVAVPCVEWIMARLVEQDRKNGS